MNSISESCLESKRTAPTHIIDAHRIAAHRISYRGGANYSTGSEVGRRGCDGAVSARPRDWLVLEIVHPRSSPMLDTTRAIMGTEKKAGGRERHKEEKGGKRKIIKR